MHGDARAEIFVVSPNVKIIVRKPALDAARFEFVYRFPEAARIADGHLNIIGRSAPRAVFDVDKSLIVIKRQRRRFRAVIPLQLVPRPAVADSVAAKISFRRRRCFP